jgi:urate oxidase/2-oxo-4-hydroxy-4-carboxy-5-ureidoimidazoline decarboxylase
MATHSAEDRILYYGKGDVLVYRTYAKPLQHVTPIPESGFTGQNNVIFALNIKMAVKGDAFLPAFTEGDNSPIVATDSMKNFILRHAAGYEGDTIEGFLVFLCNRFLDTYSQMASIEMTGDRIPFDTVQVPSNGGSLAPSGLVYRRSYNDHPSATVEVTRTEAGNVIASHQCKVSDLQLIKVSGSSFAGFVRDEYTTLPESFDRPLFIYLDIWWKYENPEDAMDSSSLKYVPAEQIRDIAHSLFHEINSPSIQHLIYKIGLRILERFPQLAQIQFESNNRTWETVIDEIPGSLAKVFTEPRPPYGFQGFTVTKADLPKGSDPS